MSIPGTPFIINIEDDEATAFGFDFVINKRFPNSAIKFIDPIKVIEFCTYNPTSTRTITNEVMPVIHGRELLKRLDTIFQVPVFAILHSGYIRNMSAGVEEFLKQIING